MTHHLKLFTPGPVDVDDLTLAEMAQPVMRNYGPEWMVIYNDMLVLLRQFFQTENDIFMIPGAASAVLDMAVGSLVETGQEIVVGTNGFFGDRLLEIVTGYGAIPVMFTAPLGEPLDPNKLRQILDNHPAAKVVILVHHETSTTVLNPLRELAKVTREAGRVMVADTVASLGGVDLPVDEWGIDVCVTASNKCLEGLPGVGFISVGPRAWELIDQQPAKGHGWYLNLRTWRHFAQEWGTWHPTPVTMPVNVILAVQASMRKILEQGLTEHYTRYARASRAVRLGLCNLGFEIFVPEAFASPVATAIRMRPEFSFGELSQWMATERGIAIAGTFGAISGKIFRIGHMGKAAGREYVMELLFSFEEFLRYQGLPVPVGASLVGLDELK